MKIAITGGTGFVGSHLARHLVREGYDVALISRGLDHRDVTIRRLPRTTFHAIGLAGVDELAQAFAGCDAVAHCAGINREQGEQTYQRVHVQGTENVVEACRRANVKKLVFMSFLRARPDCGSAYHESKWHAEQIIRASGLDYTILKPGVIYGPGDHMLDHLSHALHTFPIFALVGFKDQPVLPLAVQELAGVLAASLTDARLSNKTLYVTGPERITLKEAVQRVASVVGKRRFMFRMPVWFHYGFAWLLERTMTISMVAMAQVRILSESLAEPFTGAGIACEALPDDLRPVLPFSDELIRAGLPEPGGFGLRDCRWCARRQRVQA